jgi:cyclic beta-1,2-glucan synthetase
MARRLSDRSLARQSPAGFRLATSCAARADRETCYLSNLELTAKPAIPTHRFLGFFKKPSPWDSERPIREELFSVERLAAHAKSLAVAQTVASRPTRGLPLAARLADNSTVLLAAYRSIVKAIDDGRQITPAGEWLIDNFHLVERQIRQISTDLPPGYYRQLPKLVTGPFTGYPRVFGMAWAFVAHTDSCFDSDILVSYVKAYQEVQQGNRVNELVTKR